MKRDHDLNVGLGSFPDIHERLLTARSGFSRRLSAGSAYDEKSGRQLPKNSQALHRIMA